MFEKILYPTDLSPVSQRVIEYCKRLRDAGTREVVLIHVIETDQNIEKMPESMRNSYMSLLLKEPQKELDKIKEELENVGIKIKIRIEHGNPIKEILRIEKEENVSATILGSHGKSNIQEMLLGSVSENVIRKSIKPVIVVKRV